MGHKISIIIPILNEAEIIEKLLNHLLKNSTKKNISEIIIVDGGSTDDSQDVILKFLSGQVPTRPNNKNHSKDLEETILLLNSEKGRAKQMNFGAKKSNGDILYFLHADSFPPSNFDKDIINEIERKNKAGCFRMQFDHTHWWLRLASWLTQFRWRACRGGDQSLFITKELFQKLGEYDEQYIIYEDNDLINKLYSRDEFVVIQKKIITSARCYRMNGIWTLQYYFWSIYVKKWFGASAEELHRYYKKKII